MDIDEMLEAIRPKYGKLVVDLSEFIKQWSYKNLGESSGVESSLAILAALGTTTGMNITNIAQELGATPDVCRAIVNQKIDHEIKLKIKTKTEDLSR